MSPLALLILWLATALAQEPPPEVLPPTARPLTVDQVPDSLRAWLPWVQSEQPSAGCPLLGEERVCAWPGSLVLSAEDTGATLQLQALLDVAGPLDLPGAVGTWPQDVRVDGRAATVLDVDGVPTLPLKAGPHRVEARFRWASRPAALTVPPGIGAIELTVDGVFVPQPVVDDQGLRLGAGETTQRLGQRLDVEVARQVRDGVPVVVETRLTLRASGSGREVDLGLVLPPGTRPTSMEATLPARFSASGQLVVQVRPGTWQVTFQAVHDGPVAALTAPTLPEPWPQTEFWAVQANDRVRAMNVGGAPGIDPARTPLPEDWRTLPTYVLAQGASLDFDELRRGEPSPPPNQLTLQRELWLDTDGSGLTVRDTLTGTVHQGWRLDTLAPLSLGHAAQAGADQVVTVNAAGQGGVEVREAQLNLVAESRIDSRTGAMPAVGWDTDVSSLDGTLHLPPGWQLLTALGVDSMQGSVLSAWTLFDLFFVLVVSMALGRLLGWRWGAVALAGLVLSRHEAGAPQWVWAVLAAISALATVLPEGWPARLARWSRWLGVAVLFIILVPFAVHQVQTGLFPTLERASVSSVHSDRFTTVALDTDDAIRGGSYSRSAPMKQEVIQSTSSKRYLSSQIDPGAVVQTGPGVPAWSFEIQALRWSGPVSREHTMRLVLLGPLANLLLALARVGLLLALALRIAQLGRWLRRAPGAAAAALCLLAPALSHAEQPSDARLAELAARLAAPPACAPHCASVSAATLRVEGDQLVIVAEAHIAATTGLALPGPTKTWVPASVRVDGQQSTALTRRPDGFLHVRVEPGVHRVELAGTLPAADAITLEFPHVPHRLDFSAADWAIEGRRADGTIEGSVQLARVLSDGGASESQSSENLSPWFEVHRVLDLGLPWRVQTEVRRVGPSDNPISVRVPLLPGEAVTDGDFETIDGRVQATLERDQQSVSWVSTLDERAQLSLTAPEGVSWTEQWVLSCSPVFRCGWTGPAPLQHTVDGAFSPLWRVWPGETVTIDVYRPEAVEGQTVTIDSAHLTVDLGRRQLTAQLEATIRSSRGGQQVLTLPEGAALQSVHIDGQPRPLQAREGGTVHIPLEPGSQRVELAWQQAEPPSLVSRVPAVDLGGPAVNVEVTVHPTEQRWILALFGPRWGPVPLYWTLILLVLGAAPLLTRLPWAPLASWQWALLGLGMTQVGPWPMFVVVLWFVALGWREQHPQARWWVFDSIQLGLLGLTGAALLSLYAAIHTGLLWPFDTQVAGNGSNNRELIWFVDQTGGPMPQPLLVTAPLWVWRVVMLGWSLWLAASLVRWLPWAWRAFATCGLLKAPPKSTVAPQPTPETPES